jgi:hypothetical protein
MYLQYFMFRRQRVRDCSAAGDEDGDEGAVPTAMASNSIRGAAHLRSQGRHIHGRDVGTRGTSWHFCGSSCGGKGCQRSAVLETTSPRAERPGGERATAQSTIGLYETHQMEWRLTGVEDISVYLLVYDLSHGPRSLPQALARDVLCTLDESDERLTRTRPNSHTDSNTNVVSPVFVMSSLGTGRTFFTLPWERAYALQA